MCRLCSHEDIKFAGRVIRKRIGRNRGRGTRTSIVQSDTKSLERYRNVEQAIYDMRHVAWAEVSKKVFRLAYREVRDGKMVHMRTFVDRQQSRARPNVIGRRNVRQNARGDVCRLKLQPGAPGVVCARKRGSIARAHCPGALRKVFFC